MSQRGHSQPLPLQVGYTYRELHDAMIHSGEFGECVPLIAFDITRIRAFFTGEHASSSHEGPVAESQVKEDARSTK
jgi:hypothetical protein